MDMIELIKWALRWSIFAMAMISSGYIFSVWGEVKDRVFKVMLTAFVLTNLNILVHATGMLFEWWHK